MRGRPAQRVEALRGFIQYSGVCVCVCVGAGCQECVCWIKVITDYSEGGRVKVAVARSHETILPRLSASHTLHITN